MNEAEKLSYNQRMANKAHHELRIKWLSGEQRPTWADGTLVARHEVEQMLLASKEALELISRGYTPNHCHCEPRCSL